VEATIALLIEGGVSAASIDAIAHRSGCAKTTIYRRWSSRDALLLDAFRSALGLPASVRQPEAATLRSVVHGAIANVRWLAADRVFQVVFPTIAHELLEQSPLGAKLRSEVFQPIRQRSKELLRQDGVRQAMRQAAHPDLLFDAINGAVLYRTLIGEPVDDATVDGLTDLLLKGAAAADADD